MASPLVVRGARLLDGRGNAPVPNAVLVADAGRIVYAGAERGAPAPPTDATLVEAEGRALIPGLIDSHVHLCFDGVPDFEAEARSMDPVRAALKGARNARRALEAGITTVRDLGGVGSASLELAAAQRAGIVEGPRILTAGEVLTITGGHGHFIGREVDSAADLVRAIRLLRRAGAQVVKLIATGGVLTRGVGAQRSAFSQNELEAAVHEAHESGARVAAHATGANGIVAALEAGVDSIEHGCFLTDEALKLLLQQPTWLVATLVAPHLIAHGGAGVPEYAVRKSEEVGTAHKESFRRAVEAGVRIAAGTDAGTPYNRHGGLALELRLMHENGMPLDRLLTSATASGAELLGIEAEVGTLEAGKSADFVLLDADPLEDVGAYTEIAMVVQDGRVVLDAR